MKTTRFIHFGLVLLGLTLVLSESALSQGYQGLTPVVSTCRDVEKVLKVEACGEGIVKFEQDDEVVRFYFLQGQCESIFQRRWKAPIGSIIGVVIDFHEPKPLETVPLDLKEFIRTENDNEIFYRNEDHSIQLTVIGSNVISIWYLAPSNRPELICDGESAASVKCPPSTL